VSAATESIPCHFNFFVSNFALTGDQHSDHLGSIEGLALASLYLQEKMSAKPLSSAS